MLSSEVAQSIKSFNVLVGSIHRVETSVVIVLTTVVGKQVHPARRMAVYGYTLLLKMS